MTEGSAGVSSDGAGSKLLSTGVPGLDSVLHGGLVPNRTYLIEGDPGAGKTTLGMQFLMEGCRRGEQGLYVITSESNEELREVATNHGWPIDAKRFHIFELSPSEQSLSPESQYSMFHPAEVELGDTIRVILKAAEELKPKRVVVDSLSELRLLAHDPLRYRRQILALKHFFTRLRCTVLFLNDRSTDGEDTHLHSLSHGVIKLDRFVPEFGAERRRLEIAKIRGAKFRTGYHDFRILTGGLQVYPRLVAAEHHEPFEPDNLASGIKEMDSLLGGGIARGTSTLILGPAGTGKTTLAVQYAIAAATRGEKAAIFGFDEGRGTLMTRSKTLGLDLEKAVESGTILLRQVDPAELSPGEFTAAIRLLVDEQDLKLLVIDSLNGFLNAMVEERHLMIQLHELLSYLGQMGVTSIMIMAQHGMLSREIASPVDASYLADSVVLTRFFEHRGEVRQAISVLKKRTGPHERHIREMKIRQTGIEIGPPLKQFRGVLRGVPELEGEHEKLLGKTDA